MTGRRIGSIERAASFVDDVGFALLFPAPRLLAPSLWEAVAAEDAEPFADGMRASEQKVWTWKDELPRRGRAWYGPFLGGRGSFLAPDLLAALYPGDGTVDDHESLPLSAAAHDIAEALAAEPMASAALRSLVGDRNRYQRALSELERQLLVTRAGVQENASGWPSAVLELTCNRFEVGGREDHAAAARRFLDTVLAATPADLKRGTGWPVPVPRPARRARRRRWPPRAAAATCRARRGGPRLAPASDLARWPDDLDRSCPRRPCRRSADRADRPILEGYLAWERATLLNICAGLTG